MKKNSIFLLCMLGILAVSCSDDLEPAKPQENPQEPILTTEDITSSLVGPFTAAEPVLNLEDYNQDDAKIGVIKLDEARNLPESAIVSYKIQLSNTDTFAREYTLDAIPGTSSDESGIYYVSAQKWNDAHIHVFGKSPKKKNAYYRIFAFINTDESNYRLGGADYYVAQGTLVETCMDSGFVIEDKYYLMGNATSWNLTQEDLNDFAFNHNPDTDVYDDPVFTINFEVSQEMVDAGGCYWKIAPQSSVTNADWSTVVGTETNGDTSLEGTLVDKDAQAGNITTAGKYKMTINMETMTYELELRLQPEFLYTPGGSNGWDQLKSAWMQLKVKKDDAGEIVEQYYYGLSPLDGEFKICADSKWDNATDYGAESTTPALSGKLVNGQAGTNIVPPENGLYWMRVNYDPKSYVMTDYILTPISSVGLIGSFPASGWGSDVVMSSADEGKTWTADVTFEAGNEFKVRFNGSWDYNLGGDINALAFDGANVKVDVAGTYTVTLHLLGGVPKFTMVKK